MDSAQRRITSRNAPRNVDKIFEVADRNCNGSLGKDDLVGLLLALNPQLRVSWDMAHHLVDLVLLRYKAHVVDGRLTLAGFQRSYDEGAGDSDRDLVCLGLVPDESFESLLDETTHLEAITMPEPVPESDRSPEMGELKDCAASLVNIVNCSSVTSAQSEQAMAMLQAGNPQSDDIPALILLVGKALSGESAPAEGGFQADEVVAAALGMLCNMTFSSLENREAVRAHGGLEALGKYLRVKDMQDPVAVSICLKAAVLVTNLTICSPENQNVMKAAGIIAALVEMLDCLISCDLSGHVLTEKIVVALWSLAYDNPSNKEALREHGAIPALVRVLDPQESSLPVAQKACFALWCLVKHSSQNQAAVREAGGITVLCLLIRRFVSSGGSSDESADPSCVPRSLATIALSTIQTLANRNYENGLAVWLAGGVPPVVHLLRRGPRDELTWMAAACIWTIAFDNQENKAAIREAGGIDMLVGLLQGYPYAFCLQNAIGALRMLAVENEANSHAIRICGGVRSLIRVLEGSDEHRSLQVQCLAASALSTLACDNAENQDAIVQHGGVHTLFTLLGTARDARLIDHLSSALFELSNNNAAATLAVAEHRKAIPITIQHLVRDRPEQTKEKLAGLLCNLANASREHQDEIRAGGGIYVLREILAKEDAQEDAAMNAVAALCNLAFENEENRDAIREAGCIYYLVGFLAKSESLVAKEKAVGAICNLAYRNHPNKDEIGEVGAIPLLVDLLEWLQSAEGRQHAELAERVVGALCTLAYHNPANQAEIKVAGGVRLLKKFKKAKSDKVTAGRAKVALANIESGYSRRNSEMGGSFFTPRHHPLTPRASSASSRPRTPRHSEAGEGGSPRHWLPRRLSTASPSSLNHRSTGSSSGLILFESSGLSASEQLCHSASADPTPPSPSLPNSIEKPREDFQKSPREAPAEPTGLSEQTAPGRGKHRVRARGLKKHLVKALSGLRSPRLGCGSLPSSVVEESPPSNQHPPANQPLRSPRAAARALFGLPPL